MWSELHADCFLPPPIKGVKFSTHPWKYMHFVNTIDNIDRKGFHLLNTPFLLSVLQWCWAQWITVGCWGTCLTGTTKWWDQWRMPRSPSQSQFVSHSIKYVNWYVLSTFAADHTMEIGAKEDTDCGQGPFPVHHWRVTQKQSYSNGQLFCLGKNHENVSSCLLFLFHQFCFFFLGWEESVPCHQYLGPIRKWTKSQIRYFQHFEITHHHDSCTFMPHFKRRSKFRKGAIAFNSLCMWLFSF